jgi:hypothetical protein
MPPMEIELPLFDTYLKEREAADSELQEYVDSLQLPALKIIYEELLVNKDQVLNNVFEFLNVSPKQVQEKTLKHTSDDLRDVILNFDLLKASYAGTPYEIMFDEVLV